MKRVLSILLVLSLLASLLAGCDSAPKPGEPGKTEAPTQTPTEAPTLPPLAELPEERQTVKLPEPEPIRLAERVEEIARNLSLSGSGQIAYPAWDEPEMVPETGAADSFTGTNVQVAGIDEGDTVKTDGKYIYMLDTYGLVIVSAAGKDSEILSYTKVDYQGQGTGWPQKLYLWQSRAAVLYSISDFGTDSDGEWYDVNQVRTAIFDVSDPAKPKLLTDTAVEGTYLDSRLREGTLCLVTQKYLWDLPEEGEDFLPCLEEEGKVRTLGPEQVYLCPNPGNSALTLAAALSLETGEVTDALAFTGSTSTVYMDREGLYLARGLYTEGQSEPYREGNYAVVDYLAKAQTEIKRLELEEGKLTMTGSCLLEGSLLNQFALDGWEGYLRAATTENVSDYSLYTDEAHGWVNHEYRDRSQSNRITVLDRDLNPVGTLEGLAPEERIYACRFFEDLAYLVTFRETDPVLTVDLSDPAQPRLAGQLELPGVSMYLQGFGPDRLFGFGDPVEENGLLVNLFDVSDPSQVRLAAQKTVKGYDWSAALYDHRAILADPASGLIGFPGEGEKGAAYVLLRAREDQLQELGDFRMDYLPQDARGMLIGDLLYICSPGTTYVADPESLELLATVSNAVG